MNMKNLTKSEKLALLVGLLYLAGGIRRPMDWLGIVTMLTVFVMFITLFLKGRK